MEPRILNTTSERQASSPVVGVLVGLAGWLVLLAVMLGLLVGNRQNELKTAILNREYDERMARLQQQAAGLLAERQAQLDAAKAELTESQKDYQKVAQQTRVLLAQKALYAKALAEAQAAAPVVAAPRAVAEEPDLKALAAEKQELLGQYVAAYNQLKVVLAQLRKDSNPEALAAFARRAVKTPLGPAAAFYAAEATRKASQKEKAAALYADLVIRFPGNPYSETARGRIKSLQGKSFVASDPGIVPYRALSPQVQ